MKTGRKIVLTILGIITVVGMFACSYFLHNRDVAMEGNVIMPTILPAMTETKAPAPTDETEEMLTPTEKIKVPPTSVLEITDTPTKEPVAETGKKVTVTPVITNTPVPVTNTPVPVPTVTTTAKLQKRVQMGEAVYYEYYDDGTLLVTGKGATWDFTDYNDERFKGIKTGVTVNQQMIVIAEGITRIGDWALNREWDVKKVSFPSTLKEIGNSAFWRVGKDSVAKYGTETEWTGLDFSKLTVSPTAFYEASGIDKVAGGNLYSVSPSPVPTATPTPTPNPEKPRKCHVMKMGNDVIYEFWDNGYLYIRGSGMVSDKSELFNLTTFGEGNSNPVDKELLLTTEYVVVEEGITYLGNYSSKKSKECWLPSSLTSIGQLAGFATEKLHWYYEGKAFTAIVGESRYEWVTKIEPYTVYKFLSDSEYAEEHEGEIVITWEGGD